MPKLPQNIEERFDTVFADNMYEFGEGDGFRKQVKSFIATILEEATKEAVGGAIGDIGAKLLAKHSPQAVLDAYFDSANEVLENYEINN